MADGFTNGHVVLDGPDLLMVRQLLIDATLEPGGSVRVAIDGGLKLSLDRGTWTPPIGAMHPDPNGRES